MKKLLPLWEQIRPTDELIDAAVYKLYGLTERSGLWRLNEFMNEYPACFKYYLS